jgi:hypothetical protein
MVGRRARPGGEPAHPIQRPGLRPPGAEELADRLLTRAEHGDGTLSEADLDRLARRFQAEATRAGEVLVNLIDLFATLAGALGARPPGRPERGPAGASVMLEAVAAGTEATAVFWIHNTSPSAIPAVRPHCPNSAPISATSWRRAPSGSTRRSSTRCRPVAAAGWSCVAASRPTPRRAGTRR